MAVNLQLVVLPTRALNSSYVRAPQLWLCTFQARLIRQRFCLGATVTVTSLQAMSCAATIQGPAVLVRRSARLRTEHVLLPEIFDRTVPFTVMIPAGRFVMPERNHPRKL
jgi:hypothetical protein